MDPADKMNSKVILLLAVILLALSLCQAKMTKNKAGDHLLKYWSSFHLQEKHELEQRQGRFLVPQSFWQNAMFSVFFFILNLKGNQKQYFVRLHIAITNCYIIKMFSRLSWTWWVSGYHSGWCTSSQGTCSNTTHLRHRPSNCYV